MTQTAVKVAVVTASDSGIGKACAVALAKQGFDIGITWHSDRQGAENTASEVEKAGRKAQVLQLDLTQLPAAADVIDSFSESFGRIDMLVNNAGASAGASFLDLSFEDWRSTFSIVLDGAFLCAQRAARHMVKQGRGGRIVNITSVHEHTPLPNAVAYTAAKHGLGGLTKSMALELSPHGILVNSVAPGMVATPINNMREEDAWTLKEPGIPLGRPGHVNEIASMVAWLGTDGAAYTTGQSFIIDGGFMLVNPQFKAQKEQEGK